MPEQNGLNFRNKIASNARTKWPQMPEKVLFFLEQNNIFYIFALKIKELWQNTNDA